MGEMRRGSGFVGVIAVAMVIWFGSIGSNASAQEKQAEQNGATLGQLRAEVADVDNEISNAEKKEASLSDGLIKSLVEARLEILKLTRDMVRQRILALESGATVTVEAAGTKPDPALAATLEGEIASQSAELESARKDAAAYDGGLIGAMKVATVATKEQTMAMLQQRYLAAKYGLVLVGVANGGEKGAELQSVDAGKVPKAGNVTTDPTTVVEVKLLSKRFAEHDYQEYLWFDIEFSATGLSKPARAIKGVLNFQDLFGDPQLRISWTIEEPLKPGGSVMEKGTGFEYNQFVDSHQWVKNTALSNMTASFTVKSILYQDGSRQDF